MTEQKTKPCTVEELMHHLKGFHRTRFRFLLRHLHLLSVWFSSSTRTAWLRYSLTPFQVVQLFALLQKREELDNLEGGE